MNIDKRYVEKLANLEQGRPNKWYPRIATLGYIILILGCMFVLSGKAFGMILAPGGLILSGVMMVLQGQSRKKAKKAFMAHFDRTGQLPPYPENKKAK